MEAAFKEFTARDDVAILLISQNVANMIRNTVDQHTKVWGMKVGGVGWVPWQARGPWQVAGDGEGRQRQGERGVLGQHTRAGCLR